MVVPPPPGFQINSHTSRAEPNTQLVSTIKAATTSSHHEDYTQGQSRVGFTSPPHIIGGDSRSAQSGISFGRSGRGHPLPSNSTISSVTLNGKSYHGPNFDKKGNKLNWLLIRLRLIILVNLSRTTLRVIYNTLNPMWSDSISTSSYQFSTVRIINRFNTDKMINNFKHPKLSKNELQDDCKLKLDTWTDTGCSGKRAYVEEFVIRKTVTTMGFSSSLGKLDNLPNAQVLYAYNHEDGSVLLLEHNNTIYLGDAMQDSLSNPLQPEEVGVRVDLSPKRYYEGKGIHKIPLSRMELYCQFYM